MIMIDKQECFPAEVCAFCKKLIGKFGSIKMVPAYYLWNPETLLTLSGPFCSHNCASNKRQTVEQENDNF